MNPNSTLRFENTSTGYRFGPGLNKDKNGVPFKDDMPAYQEEGVYSFANAVYYQRGAIMDSMGLFINKRI
jgi:hypothetical protein